MATTNLYDSKCFDLAEAFLSDEEDYDDWSPELQRERTSMLASHIQEAIESWLQYELGVLREGQKP